MKIPHTWHISIVIYILVRSHGIYLSEIKTFGTGQNKFKNLLKLAKLVLFIVHINAEKEFIRE